MNPNLTPVQRAARNLFAAETDTTDMAIVELAFLTPTVAKLAEDMAVKMLSGPFGDFAPVVADDSGRTIVSPNHEEGYRQGHLAGYVDALNQVDDQIDALIEVLPLDGGQVALEALTTLKTEVGSGIESASPTPSGVDVLTEVLSELFGREVRVVKIG